MGKDLYRPFTPEKLQEMKVLLAQDLIGKELRPRVPMLLTGNTAGWNSMR
jgi:hypothetical protein